MSTKSKGKTKDEFLYCSNLKCKQMDCARHNVNTPWNEPVYRDKFEPNKDGECKGFAD